MAENEKLCPTCMTGADLVKLDRNDVMCEYLYLCGKDGCRMYVPICGGEEK